MRICVISNRLTGGRILIV